MSSTKKQYGVFSGELNEHAGTALAMGVFIGSSWAVAAVIACSIAMLTAGTDTASLRWILSIVLGMLSGGILQQLFWPPSLLGRRPFVYSIIQNGRAPA